jgi:hypothetical protein
MTRVQLCGRITALRRALDELKAQAEADGQGCIPGYGALKVSLLTYRNALQDHDAAQRGQAVSDLARDLLVAPLTVQLAAVVNHALARREG